MVENFPMIMSLAGGKNIFAGSGGLALWKHAGEGWGNLTSFQGGRELHTFQCGFGATGLTRSDCHPPKYFRDDNDDPCWEYSLFHP